MRLIALEYHDIVRDDSWEESGFPGSAAATYKLSVEHFEQHLDALQRSGTRVLNNVGLLRTDTATDPVPVVITFDDGGSGFLNYAADQLERRGFRGHVFMTTGCIGKPGFLAGSDLLDLERRGHVIGSHSRTHPPRLSALSRAAIIDEWAASIADLEDVLGKTVEVASVPGGFHSDLVAELAAAQGIRTLFTSEPVATLTTVDGCTVVGRFTLRRGDPPAYVSRLVGRAPFARGTQWCQWNAKKVLKSLGGRYYQRVRERMLGP